MGNLHQQYFSKDIWSNSSVVMHIPAKSFPKNERKRVFALGHSLLLPSQLGPVLSGLVTTSINTFQKEPGKCNCVPNQIVHAKLSHLVTVTTK